MEAPFTTSLSEFRAHSVLTWHNKLAVVQGDVNGKTALVKLEPKSPWAAESAVLALLPRLRLKLTNYSGAEYSFYDGEAAGELFCVEVVCPASQRQIARHQPSDVRLVDETPEMYSCPSERPGWIDAVCSLDKEKDRNLYVSDQFIVNIDTKWDSHAPTSTPRETWKNAHFVKDLYLLAISKDPNLKTLRELRGEPGAALCDAMRTTLLDVALQVYGVPHAKLRVYFHYRPQFYRLHAHCTRIENINPGCEAERAHLLSTVATNLRLCGDYYARATIPTKVYTKVAT